MAYGYVDDNCFKDIANSIRSKTGSSANYYPGDMANAINNISGGGNLGTKTITANGLYNASDDSLDGYNAVTVAVPMPVYNSGELNVIQNGIYDASDNGLDGFNKVTVNVPEKTFNTNTLNVSSNGVYNALTSGLDGYTEVNVQVPITSFNTTTLDVTENGTYNAVTSGYDGYTEVTVNVPTEESFVINENGKGFVRLFNQPVKIDPSVTNYYYMFGDLQGFNQPVDIPEGVTDCSQMFSWCDFNREITIPNSVDNCAFMFYGGSFNQDITLPYTLRTFFGGLQSDKTFGKNVYFDNASVSHTNIFTNCNNSLQKNIYVNNISSLGTLSTTGAFVGGVSLSFEQITNGYRNTAYNIYIYNNYLGMITDSSLYAKFQGNASFDLAIKTANTVQNMSQMLNGCSNFNNSILISDSVTDISGMCNNCYNFNSPVIIGNNVQDMGAAFRNAYSFNQPITIPESSTNCRTMLQNTKFNQPLIIPNNVTNCKWMLFDAMEFNQPITIGSKVVDCSQMLESYNYGEGGGKFNQDIYFPYSAVYYNYALGYQTNFESNIYINNRLADASNFSVFVGYMNNSKRKNIFCYNLSVLNRTSSPTITGQSMSWTQMDNGYYNSAYNIYLYNNYLGQQGTSSLYQMFQGNTTFDLAISTTDTVVNMAYMMNGCSNFNNSVQIGNNVTNCRSILMDCTNYNRPIHFPNSVVNARSALWGCTNFNSPITFDDAQYNIDLRGFLADTAFNQPITLPNGTRNCQALFQNCHNFNQPIVIPDSVDSTEGAAYFLFNATSFNSSITIGNNVTNCHQMMEAYWWDGSTDHFEGGSFNQPIIFPKSVATVIYALAGQQNMKADIVLHNNACNYSWFLGNAHYEGNIYCPNGIWASRINNMFEKKNNTSGIASIYTPQSYSDYNGAIRSYQPTGNSDTWVGDETNELVYSPTANIYIYCNWNGVIPS